MKITAYCAARTHENDIRPIAEIFQKTGLPIEVAAFLGSSPIRRYTEGWNGDFLLQTTEKAVKFAVSLGLDVMYVTEDTTRCDPDTVKQLYSAAINFGARALVLCDTAGHATPMGTVALVNLFWKKSCIPRAKKFVSTGTATAIADSPSRTPWPPSSQAPTSSTPPPSASESASAIRRWIRCWSISSSWESLPGISKTSPSSKTIARRFPLHRRPDSRELSCCRRRRLPHRHGVHAAAVIKAYRKKDIELANTVYSGVPSHYFGLDQIIDIGPMSGKSNVLFWLEHRGFAINDEVVERIYKRAKSSNHTLTESEILEWRVSK